LFFDLLRSDAQWFFPACPSDEITQAASIFGRVPCPPHNDHSSPTGDPITETLFQVIGFQQHMRAL